jgi:signal transduction histidine kinase
MQNAAGRMQSLINDLLAFSRVSTRAQPLERVDLGQIAREVMIDLEETVRQCGGHVELGELPTLAADPLQMRQLLQNLIANALKFSKPGEPPIVRVHGRVSQPQGCATDTEPICELLVEDNGIGFDEKYLDRIFNVFQRLHARGTYEGTGIGLAVCRKIAERHGGTITAASEPGKGSTFIVTIPMRSTAAADDRERRNEHAQ